MTVHLQPILAAFHLFGEPRVHEITAGHINRTYRVDLPDASWLVQGLNPSVFPDGEAVMANILAVTEHLRRAAPDRPVARYLTAEDGRPFLLQDGLLWRVTAFVPSTAYSTCLNETLARKTSEAFGDFQRYLADFDATRLRETLPGFHDTRRRYAHLKSTLAHADPALVAKAQDVLTWLLSAEKAACALLDLSLPLRVTHNDTKISNVLFTPDGNEPLMVIDLDTVMPGRIAYDFGDAIRGLFPEDEADLTQVRLDETLFTAYAEGFLSRCGELLTPEERGTLPLGVFAVTVEQAVRFLDDYLDGSRYYRVAYPEHNLVRARCQTALAQEIQRRMPALEAVVHQKRRPL